jgi:hypothetical protein
LKKRQLKDINARLDASSKYFSQIALASVFW